MAPKLTPDDVRRIAGLSQLAVTPDQVEHFAEQLTAILGYAEAVQAVDTTGIAPMSHPLGLESAGRADEVTPSVDRAEVLSSAPDADHEAGLFRVPRVLQRDA